MFRTLVRRTLGLATALALIAGLAPTALTAQRGGGAGGSGDLPSIADKTAGMEHMDGFLPLYWDGDMGQLWMEIPEFGTEMIHFMGFGAGLGHVLAHAVNGGELVLHPFDVDALDRGALYRGDQHPAQGVAYGDAEAALEGL